MRGRIRRSRVVEVDSVGARCGKHQGSRSSTNSGDERCRPLALLAAITVDAPGRRRRGRSAWLLCREWSAPARRGTCPAQSKSSCPRRPRARPRANSSRLPTSTTSAPAGRGHKEAHAASHRHTVRDRFIALTPQARFRSQPPLCNRFPRASLNEVSNCRDRRAHFSPLLPAAGGDVYGSEGAMTPATEYAPAPREPAVCRRPCRDRRDNRLAASGSSADRTIPEGIRLQLQNLPRIGGRLLHNGPAKTGRARRVSMLVECRTAVGRATSAPDELPSVGQPGPGVAAVECCSAAWWPACARAMSFFWPPAWKFARYV